MKYDGRVTGVIVLSKLGLNQFNIDDLTLLESVATHAAVAFEETSRRVRGGAPVGRDRERAPARVEVPHAPEPAAPGDVGGRHVALRPARPAARVGMAPRRRRRFPQPGARGLHRGGGRRHGVPMEVSGELGERYLLSTEDPFFIPAEVIAQMPPELNVAPRNGPAARRADPLNPTGSARSSWKARECSTPRLAAIAQAPAAGRRRRRAPSSPAPGGGRLRRRRRPTSSARAPRPPPAALPPPGLRRRRPPITTASQLPHTPPHPHRRGDGADAVEI